MIKNVQIQYPKDIWLNIKKLFGTNASAETMSNTKKLQGLTRITIGRVDEYFAELQKVMAIFAATGTYFDEEWYKTWTLAAIPDYFEATRQRLMDANLEKIQKELKCVEDMRNSDKKNREERWRSN